jgi:hypothetical protein
VTSSTSGYCPIIHSRELTCRMAVSPGNLINTALAVSCNEEIETEA